MAHPVRLFLSLDVLYESHQSTILSLWTFGRYIYVPLGGSNSAIIPKLLVFTFVALWHDLSMRLLVWGWLISLFILPEVIASQLLPESKVRSRHFSTLPLLYLISPRSPCINL